jgi:hypothetical protein
MGDVRGERYRATGDRRSVRGERVTARRARFGATAASCAAIVEGGGTQGDRSTARGAGRAVV